MQVWYLWGTTAVATALLGYPVWVGMIAAVIVSLVVSYLVGLLCVRTKAVQFLLITLAFGQMFYALAEKTRYTGGDDGITGIPRFDLSFLGLDSDNDRVFYFLVLVFFCLAMLVLRRIVVSPFGRVLVGIRENEKRMLAVGYSTYPYKALAFGLSGVLGGLAGSLWVQHSFFVNPQLMTWQMSGETLLMVIIGGYEIFVSPIEAQSGLTNYIDRSRHTVSLGAGVALRDLARELPGTVTLDAHGQLGQLVTSTTRKTSAADLVGDYTAGSRSSRSWAVWSGWKASSLMVTVASSWPTSASGCGVSFGVWTGIRWWKPGSLVNPRSVAMAKP